MLKKVLAGLLIGTLFTTNSFAVTKEECKQYAQNIKNIYTTLFTLTYADNKEEFIRILKLIKVKYSYSNKDKTCEAWLVANIDEMPEDVKKDFGNADQILEKFVIK